MGYKLSRDEAIKLAEKLMEIALERIADSEGKLVDAADNKKGKYKKRIRVARSAHDKLGKANCVLSNDGSCQAKIDRNIKIIRNELDFRYPKKTQREERVSGKGKKKQIWGAVTERDNVLSCVRGTRPPKKHKGTVSREINQKTINKLNEFRKKHRLKGMTLDQVLLRLMGRYQEKSK